MSEPGETRMITLDGRELKVGDRLWSTAYGWVEVKQTEPDLAFAIRTTLGSYSASGKYSTYGPRSLFWDEVKIDPPPPPKRKVKKWLWLVIFDTAFVTSEKYTEAEARRIYGACIIRPIEETMIEVEE